jgi:hypothetical protein
MKVPISIVERNGDVSTYASVKDAEAAMEAADVENNEYVAKDADGRQLNVCVVVDEVRVLWGLWRIRTKVVRLSDPSSNAR